MDRLREIPGVGIAVAKDLRMLGIHEPEALREEDPE